MMYEKLAEVVGSTPTRSISSNLVRYGIKLRLFEQLSDNIASNANVVSYGLSTLLSTKTAKFCNFLSANTPVDNSRNVSTEPHCSKIERTAHISTPTRLRIY